MGKYIYMMHNSDYENNIFKIGITSIPKEIFEYYPKNSKYIIIFEFQDARYLENIMLSKFAHTYRTIYEIGDDYFEGNIETATKKFAETCLEIENLCIRYPLQEVPPPTFQHVQNVQYTRQVKPSIPNKKRISVIKQSSRNIVLFNHRKRICTSLKLQRRLTI